METFLVAAFGIIGLALMAFGIYFFYAFLPLWYGLFGAYIGYGISYIWFSTGTAENLLTWLLVIGLALTFALLAYKLEPYRRYLLGLLVGVSFGILLSVSIVVEPMGSLFLAITFGIIFALASVRFFDAIIIAGSALNGAALVMDSVFYFTGWDAVERFGYRPLPTMIWVSLTALGIVWQLVARKNWQPID